jgi:hypothetical protein
MSHHHRYGEVGRLFNELAHGAAVQAQRYRALSELFGTVEPRDEPLPDHGAEMAVHPPTEPCAPPANAEFAPDDPGVVLGLVEPPSSGVRPIVQNPSDTPAVENVPCPPSGVRRKRGKAEYTAQEWAYSVHFAALMKKAPYSSMTAAERIDKRDAFVETYKAAPPQNRWGRLFSAFCNAEDGE